MGPPVAKARVVATTQLPPPPPELMRPPSATSDDGLAANLPPPPPSPGVSTIALATGRPGRPPALSTIADELTELDEEVNVDEVEEATDDDQEQDSDAEGSGKGGPQNSSAGPQKDRAGAKDSNRLQTRISTGKDGAVKISATFHAAKPGSSPYSVTGPAAAATKSTKERLNSSQSSTGSTTPATAASGVAAAASEQVMTAAPSTNVGPASSASDRRGSSSTTPRGRTGSLSPHLRRPRVKKLETVPGVLFESKSFEQNFRGSLSFFFLPSIDCLCLLSAPSA